MLLASLLCCFLNLSGVDVFKEEQNNEETEAFIEGLLYTQNQARAWVFYRTE